VSATPEERPSAYALFLAYNRTIATYDGLLVKAQHFTDREGPADGQVWLSLAEAALACMKASNALAARLLELEP
jgi:hypothetical protein